MAYKFVLYLRGEKAIGSVGPSEALLTIFCVVILFLPLRKEVKKKERKQWFVISMYVLERILLIKGRHGGY